MKPRPPTDGPEGVDAAFLSLLVFMIIVSGQIKVTSLLHQVMTEIEQQACALVFVEDQTVFSSWP